MKLQSNRDDIFWVVQTAPYNRLQLQLQLQLQWYWLLREANLPATCIFSLQVASADLEPGYDTEKPSELLYLRVELSWLDYRLIDKSRIKD